ncbi:hypothetical protein [Mycolicibacter virginiensis]|uniref:hypothetical protein n=1 Tax=Mycolicibacter virginiensis TaxID=1795032 RepID=UPI001F04DAB8|nr:hypothetical protein [Mycolicibacter virginiensis]ULP48059.1 hypothetical protein MJO54_02485 [Mycolicibacter virginiensis]
MSRIPNPSHEDIFQSRAEAPKAAATAVHAVADAVTALRQVAAQTSATPDEVIAAVGLFRSGQAAVEAALLELIGVAVLGGASISAAATAAGVRRETLGRRLAGTAAGKRGEAR